MHEPSSFPAEEVVGQHWPPSQEQSVLHLDCLLFRHCCNVVSCAKRLSSEGIEVQR